MKKPDAVRKSRTKTKPALKPKAAEAPESRTRKSFQARSSDPPKSSRSLKRSRLQAASCSDSESPRQSSEVPEARLAPSDTTSADSYERKKVTENNKAREASEDKREIGAIPAPKDPKRRAGCQLDFGKFLKTYFPHDTRHPWSNTHLKLIKLIEIVVLVGALLAMGIPRGWGKTFLSVRAIIWAVAYRHHTMCLLIAASDPAAADLIQDLRDELETNELLREDFPEICLPMRALEGINQRGKGQTSGGVQTKVKAADHELHLGDVNGQPGAVIYSGGITGSKIRGRRKKRGDKVERPTLGLVDDFQTRTSARSKMQCQTRLNIVQDDIPGLPGPDQAWSCLLTCTVIEPDDAADQLLDRSKHPDWRGIRQAFLESLPNAEALNLWDEWNRIRCEDLQADDEEAISERAHDFYRKRHKAMNAGAAVAWKYAFKPEHYVDALEKAMQWYFRSRRGFWSELQNQPDKFEISALPQLQAHILAVRRHHLAQHVCPKDAEWITAHADVSKAVLWFEVRAWAQDSTSWTIDYGAFPDQRRAYFTQKNARNTIDEVYKHLPSWEIRCMAAIRDLFTQLFEKPFLREDNTALRLNIAGIDANDETETVRNAIRKSGLSGKLWPMHSRSFRLPKPSLNDLPKKDGDVIGDNWRRRKPEAGTLRYITYDTDRWKSHHRDRLLVPADWPGSISWFGGVEHRMMSEHHTAEFSDTMFHPETGRQMEVWSLRPNEENHLWDVGVGNDVLGSVLGLKLPASALLTGNTTVQRRKKRKKIRVTI